MTNDPGMNNALLRALRLLHERLESLSGKLGDSVCKISRRRSLTSCGVDTTRCILTRPNKRLKWVSPMLLGFRGTSRERTHERPSLPGSGRRRSVCRPDHLCERSAACSSANTRPDADATAIGSRLSAARTWLDAGADGTGARLSATRSRGDADGTGSRLSAASSSRGADSTGSRLSAARTWTADGADAAGTWPNAAGFGPSQDPADPSVSEQGHAGPAGSEKGDVGRSRYDKRRPGRLSVPRTKGDAGAEQCQTTDPTA